MDQELDQPIEVKDPKLKDIASSWVDSSSFLFYLQILILVALFVGGSYGLYINRYKGKPEVNVPGNTLYTPQYK
jgi:hypothetical protein